MINYLESKFSKIFSWVVLILLVALGFFYFLVVKTPEKNEPLTIIASFEGAPTTFPTDFPKEVVRENETLEDFRVGTQGADGEKKDFVSSTSYISDKNMQSVFDTYVKDLPNAGWNIVGKSLNENVSVIRATKENEGVLLLAMALLEEGGIKVTFQYEK